MKFVIWSYEHSAWWRPNHCGYTDSLDAAGRYDAKEAGVIVIDTLYGGGISEIAMTEHHAEKLGAPLYHPHDGQKLGAYR